MEWLKLEGKKVLVIGCNDVKPIKIGKIVGCDPDIGICIANLNETEPWFVVPGPSSPIMIDAPEEYKSLRRMELESIFRQLQGGVFSRYLDKKEEIRIYGEVEEGKLGVTCPFTM